MIEIMDGRDASKCCGCGVCALVCPTQAISMTEDVYGFIYPSVDKTKCIACGKCESICPILNYEDKNFIGQEAHVVYSKDAGIRFRGSSGGVFETVARQVLEEGGTVFGAAFDESLVLRHVEANTVDELVPLCKSKYLQSKCDDACLAIRERLKAGREVLFCGTPCQAAALESYVGKALREKLLLLSFACHGVPSQRMFTNCLRYMEKKKGIRILHYAFRSKIIDGATPYYFTYVYREKDGKETSVTDIYLNSPFHLGFHKDYMERDSCYDCPFRRGNHKTDITIGDFHEVDRYISGLNRFDGVSLLIVNTDKGRKYWDKIQTTMQSYDIDIHRLKEDRQIHPGAIKPPKERNIFMDDLISKPFPEVTEKWLNPKKEWKKAIYYQLPTPVRNVIKSIWLKLALK